MKKHYKINSHLFSALLVSIVFCGSLLALNSYKEEIFPHSTSDYNCQNIYSLVDLFSENFPNVKFETKILASDDYDTLEVRTSLDKPIQVYQAESVSYAKIEDEKLLGLTTSIYKKRIEPELLNLGFIKSYSYNKNIVSLDRFQYHYGTGLSVISIQIPSDKEAQFPSNYIKISCGKVNPEYQKVIEKFTNLYTKDASIEVSELKDNVAVINVNLENSMVGQFRTYDISKEKPELIYNGSERINCSTLKARNIGKGIRCFNNNGQEILNN